MTPCARTPLSPPRRAVWLLGRVAPPDIRDRTLDDLEELFEAEARMSTPALAHRWYWKQTLKGPFRRSTENVCSGQPERTRPNPCGMSRAEAESQRLKVCRQSRAPAYAFTG